MGKDITGGYTLRMDAYEVQLNVSVIDAAGHHIDNLTPDAFEVFEDGVRQTIASLRHEDVPVSIGLLIDSSASMYDKRAAVDEAAINLMRLSNPKDEAFLVNFNSKAYIDQDLTSSLDKLQQGMHFVNSKGGTAAYDAVMASAEYLARFGKNSKQVLVLVTDGEDNASRTSMQTMIHRVQRLDGPVIYCVGLLFGENVDKAVAQRAKALLEEIAKETGGAAFFPRSLKDVGPVASIVAEDVRTQYAISYSSTNPPSNGGYRFVKVDVVDRHKKKLIARTRKGYIPKPTPSLTGAR
ncbi:MAG: VWA domain-containing protein [Edaphobacter sp.]